jgi:cobalt-zinc-cadmium efflux system outer membrane protein
MKRLIKTLLVLGMLVLAAGCASEESLIEPPSESTLGEKNYEQSPALNLSQTKPIDYEEFSIGDTLRYAEALSLALTRSPQLEGFAWQVRIQEARRIQASRLPNPVIAAGIENIGGTGPFSGLGSSETSVRLSQEVLLGADRLKLKRVAGFEKDLAGWDYESARLDVLTGVTQAYVTVLEAQRQVQLQEELVGISLELYQTVQSQVQAGKVSPLAETRARVQLSNTQIDLRRARQNLEAVQGNLVSFWGEEDPQFKVVTGKLDMEETLPELEDLSAYIERNPDVARWMTEIAHRESIVGLEKARQIPNPSIGGGYLRFNDIDAEALSVGISIPLPVFNLNRGNIKAARYQVRQAETDQIAARVEAKRALQSAYRSVEAARQEVILSEDEVLPGSQRALEAAQTGYRQGKFDYLEVLDAQRTLFTSRTRYIQALAEYNRAAAEVERLIGTPLSEITSN